MTLIELFHLLKKNLKLVCVLPVACALVMLVYSYLGMGNVYTASTSLYVLTKSGNENSSMLSSDLSASQLLANDIAALAQSDRVLNDTASDLGLEDLKDYKIEVAGETTTRVITVSVTGPTAESAADVANKVAENCSTVAQEVMDVDSINVVDKAVAPTSPSGPKRMLYTAVAFAGGLFAAVAVVVLKDILDTRVRDAEDLENLLEIPVIGRIPAIKGGN